MRRSTLFFGFLHVDAKNNCAMTIKEKNNYILMRRSTLSLGFLLEDAKNNSTMTI
jgi:hypothetical protein